MIEHAVDVQLLRHELRNQLPVVVERDLGADARAAVNGVVEVVFDVGNVVDDHRVGGCCVAVGGLGEADHARQIGVLAEHIVDVAAFDSVVEHGANGELVVDDRDVDVALDAVARVTLAGRRPAGVEAGLELVVDGLVGDQAHRAGLRTRAEQRALRAGQHLDARDVGRVQVEVAAARTDRLLVEIERDVRHRRADLDRGLVGRVGGHAADEYRRLARAAAGRVDVRQVADVVVEIGDIEFVELLLAQRLDGDRRVLQAGGALGRRDRYLLEFRGGRQRSEPCTGRQCNADSIRNL